MIPNDADLRLTDVSLALLPLLVNPYTQQVFKSRVP